MSDAANQGTNGSGCDPWMTLLFDEYKVLQDKIDKIGASRFTIKGWLVTITAATVALATTDNASVWASLLPLPVSIAFFVMERRQHQFSNIYSSRAREIEVAMAGLRSGRLKDLTAVKYIPGASTTMMIELARRRHRIPWKALWKDSEYSVYLVQMLLIPLITAFLLFRAPKEVKQAESMTILGPTIHTGQEGSPNSK